MSKIELNICKEDYRLLRYLESIHEEFKVKKLFNCEMFESKHDDSYFQSIKDNFDYPRIKEYSVEIDNTILDNILKESNIWRLRDDLYYSDFDIEEEEDIFYMEIEHIPGINLLRYSRDGCFIIKTPDRLYSTEDPILFLDYVRDIIYPNSRKKGNSPFYSYDSNHRIEYDKSFEEGFADIKFSKLLIEEDLGVKFSPHVRLFGDNGFNNFSKYMDRYKFLTGYYSSNEKFSGLLMVIRLLSILTKFKYYDYYDREFNLSYLLNSDLDTIKLLCGSGHSREEDPSNNFKMTKYFSLSSGLSGNNTIFLEENREFCRLHISNMDYSIVHDLFEKIFSVLVMVLFLHDGWRNFTKTHIKAAHDYIIEGFILFAILKIINTKKED